MHPTALTARGRLGETRTTNRLICNTYGLLALTLTFSAACAGASMALNAPPLHWLLVIGGYFALLFAVHKTAQSSWGLLWTFVLTGFIGLTLGPIVNSYIAAYANGGELVLTALGGTASIFVGLSTYALASRRDFRFMGGFLFAGILVGFLAGIGAMVFSIPALSLAVSASFILLMSGYILFETSRLIHEPGMNYILATVSLYVAILNLFLSLLHLLGAFAGQK